MATISTKATTITTSTATATASSSFSMLTTMTMEPRKSYNELCRLCASYDAIRMDIFGKEGRNRRLVDKIQTCLPFKVNVNRSIVPLFAFFAMSLMLSCSSWNLSSFRFVRVSFSHLSFSFRLATFLVFFSFSSLSLSLYFVYISESPPSRLHGPARLVLDLILPRRE